MSFTKLLCLVLIIVSFNVLVENRSYNNGLIFYNLVNEHAYLPPTISVSRGRGLAKFKYSPRGSIWSTFGKPCDCSGPLCGCCVGIKVKQYNFDQKICANVSYAAPKDEIQLEVFLNETATAKYGVAARNPSPLCIPVMMGIPMSMCIQMSNIAIQGENLNMCMDFLVRLASTELFEMHFQCMKMGLQGVSWVGASGQPVIPPSESKLKDVSSAESDEYYDEEGDDNENEVVSKESETEKLTVNNEEEGEENKNKAEEEMDYNDITEKVIVNEKDELALPGIEENLIDNETNTPDIKEEPLVLNGEESKTESYEISEEEVTTVAEENEDNKKEEATIKQEILSELNEIITVATEMSTPETLDNMEEFEDYSDEIQTESIQNILPPTPEESNENMDEILSTISDVNTATTTLDIEEQNMTEIPIGIQQINETEKLQYEKETSSELEKFDMLTKSKEDDDEEEEEETTVFPQNESEFNNNSIETFKMPLETSTEHVIVANFKPTMAATITTSETSNIENVDNAITTATIMTTTTMTSTTATATMKPLTTADNNAAAAAVTFIETNNNNKSNDDSDKSQDNDSEYENEDEESDDKEEDYQEEETDDNEETTTISILNKENIAKDQNNQETLNEHQNYPGESTTKEISYESLSNESNTSEEATTNEISNSSSSNEINSNDTENHSDEHVDYEDAEDEDVNDGESYEEDGEDIETTTITKPNSNSDEIDETIKTTTIPTSNGTAATMAIIQEQQQQQQFESTDTNNPPSSNNLTLTSSVFNSVATDSSSNNSTTPNNMSQITTATVVPLPLARTLFTLHHHNRRRQH